MDKPSIAQLRPEHQDHHEGGLLLHLRGPGAHCQGGGDCHIVSSLLLPLARVRKQAETHPQQLEV